MIFTRPLFRTIGLFPRNELPIYGDGTRIPGFVEWQLQVHKSIDH